MTRRLMNLMVVGIVVWMVLVNWPSIYETGHKLFPNIQLASTYKHHFINRCTVSKGLYQEALFNLSNKIVSNVSLDCEILNPINIALILQIFFGSCIAHFYVGSYAWCIFEMVLVGLFGIMFWKNNMAPSITKYISVVSFLSLILYIVNVYYFALNAFDYNQEMKNMDILTINRSHANFELCFR